MFLFSLRLSFSLSSSFFTFFAIIYFGNIYQGRMKNILTKMIKAKRNISELQYLLTSKKNYEVFVYDSSFRAFVDDSFVIIPEYGL